MLAHYFLGYDEDMKRYVIGPKGGDWNAVMIGEGEWHDFIESGVYKSTRNEDRISYFWDQLIQRTCQHALDGTVLGNADLFRGPSAIFEMVREPRFIRRALSAKMLRAVENFPSTPGHYSRQVTFMPSFTPNVGYVFLQIWVPKEMREQADFREKRAGLLEIVCGAAKIKFPH